jgi:hypothetical protein
MYSRPGFPGEREKLCNMLHYFSITTGKVRPLTA